MTIDAYICPVFQRNSWWRNRRFMGIEEDGGTEPATVGGSSQLAYTCNYSSASVPICGEGGKIPGEVVTTIGEERRSCLKRQRDEIKESPSSVGDLEGFLSFYPQAVDDMHQQRGYYGYICRGMMTTTSAPIPPPLSCLWPTTNTIDYNYPGGSGSSVPALDVPPSPVEWSLLPPVAAHEQDELYSQEQRGDDHVSPPNVHYPSLSDSDAVPAPQQPPQS